MAETADHEHSRCGVACREGVEEAIKELEQMQKEWGGIYFPGMFNWAADRLERRLLGREPVVKRFKGQPF